MSKIKIIVRSSHVIFGDTGQQMAMGEIHTVGRTPAIESLISDGLVSVITDETVSEETPKDATPNKNLKKQETVSTSPTGEI